ncbi:MAG: O-succinylhomoserine sulfhydrylase [Candidatus Pacebacteria bacterium]|nr:O-succinylhomoserine sulfhydrylase [Candidatus Paceibacterota bacterium]
MTLRLPDAADRATALKVTSDPDQFQLETKLVRGGHARSHHGEMTEALYMTQAYAYDNAEMADGRLGGTMPGFTYSRYGNPTVEIFERRMAVLEGAEACFSTGTGMAAVFASMACFLDSGDHVVAPRALFGSCFYVLNTLFPRWGITATFVDGTDMNEWRRAVTPKTKAFFLETPANPTLELVDLKAVIALGKEVGAKVIVDNVFASPILQKPIAMGADIVVYSATKHIDGQGRCLGGVVLADEKFCTEKLQPFLRHTGPALSPFNAWLLLKGLETLSLRVERAQSSATAIAEFLEKQQPLVSRVRYPTLPSFPQHNLAKAQMSGGGTMVCFELAGGKEAAFIFENALELIDIANNLGDSKSMITHPMTTTHRAIAEEDRAKMGITQGMIRLSVGLESAVDLQRDLAQALAVLGKRG